MHINTVKILWMLLNSVDTEFSRKDIYAYNKRSYDMKGDRENRAKPSGFYEMNSQQQDKITTEKQKGAEAPFYLFNRCQY
ncbi:hypothetical protein [Photobacterium sanguinicancri]|uniref:hypothetical protein n=1 Tax=Photobacterium sanguinicancri TaxID=875932 RepID=UPI000788EACD|nr:hypothetical protein [Photobacterium sanguinicancri]KXI23800.1 hypothetical protein AS132_05500 [Photobacterium sanguinicancri]